MHFFRWDFLTGVMLALVGGIGLAIVRYSRTYLQGAAGAPRYFRWLFVTLGAVAGTVAAKNLLLIAVAWLTTSLALHQLLTFFPGRGAAIIAAHKKFLVSRAADLCLAACLVVVNREVGSLDLDRIDDWTRAHPDLSPAMHVAAALLAIAVLLKSAQLPFHGWLTQVMEAPTPVSALLHAGIVNVGGFVLIRLAPWMERAHAARMLLLVVGLVTTVIAALVMTTRVSVKVALAWSTCAQMGFMLVECGLGAWHLALLHLVAHSLYKAHAFLSAGTTVARWQVMHRSPAATSSPWLVAVASLAAAAAVSAALRDFTAGVLALLLLLSMGQAVVKRAPIPLFVGLLYVGFHALAARLLSADVFPRPAEIASWALAGAGFLTLFIVKSLLLQRPHSSLSRALYPWLFAGLYLDDWFTRIAFRIWPPRLGPSEVRKPALSRPNAVEA